MLPALIAAGLGVGRVATGVAKAAVSVGKTVGPSLGKVAQGATKALAGGARGAKSIVGKVASKLTGAGGESQAAPANNKGVARIEQPLSGEIMPAQAEQLPALTQSSDVGFERVTEALSPLEQAVAFWERTAEATERTADGVERIGDIPSGDGGVEAMAAQADDADRAKASVVKTKTTKSGGGDGMLSGIMNTISGFVKSASKIFAMLSAAVALLFVGDLSDVFNKMKDVFTKIVTALGPVFEMIGEKVLPPLFDLFNSLVDVFMNIVEVLTPIIGKLIETILPPLIETITLLADIFGKIITFLSPVLVVIGEAVGDLATDILKLVNLVLKFLTDPIGYLQDGLAFLANGGDSILVGMGNFINGIIEFFAGLADKIPFVGEGIGATLREAKVDFGNDAQERIDTRTKETGEREVNRQVESLASMSKDEQTAELDKRVADGDITAEQRVAIEEKLKGAGQGEPGTNQDVTPVAPPADNLNQESPATKVDPQGDILSMLNGMNPTVGPDGSVLANVTINGKGVVKKITASDFSPFPAEEVTKALQTQGIITSGASAGFMVAEATSGALDTNGPSVGAGVGAASVDTAQSALAASGTGGGGGQVNQMNTVNAPSNVVNSTTTGVIYTDDSSLKSNGKRLLPGMSRYG